MAALFYYLNRFFFDFLVFYTWLSSIIIEMERKEGESIQKQKIKIVFMGDRGVGKSSVISKFALNKF